MFRIKILLFRLIIINFFMKRKPSRSYCSSLFVAVSGYIGKNGGMKGRVKERFANMPITSKKLRILYYWKKKLQIK